MTAWWRIGSSVPSHWSALRRLSCCACQRRLNLDHRTRALQLIERLWGFVEVDPPQPSALSAPPEN
ncbi:hypothetical protein [Micromonospora musae]|uniref:hypothetical protein n=1 Tax=Micromonospora musae TaxID=1894970 RepID=UPI0013155827|nr:hypothetical protein [Micromonospora musae]